MGIALRVLGGVASVAVLIAVYRGRGHGVPRRSGGLGRGYWLVVADEVAALAAGLALLNGPFDPPQAGVAWVSFVIGIHFVALARVTHEPVCHWLGGAITACGVAGLALVVAGATQALVAVISGILPGALLLASGCWGVRQAGDEQTPPTH